MASEAITRCARCTTHRHQSLLTPSDSHFVATMEVLYTMRDRGPMLYLCV